MSKVIGSGGGGGKGGGGGGGTPTEAKDNLDSKQFAKVLDLIGEGEIEGLVDGAKSIFLNNTVIVLFTCYNKLPRFLSILPIRHIRWIFSHTND